MNRTILGFLFLSLGTAFYACGGSTETTDDGDDKKSSSDDDDDSKADDDDDDDTVAVKDASVADVATVKDAAYVPKDANLPGEPIDFKDTCAPVTACDPSVVGTWALGGGCVDVLNKFINQAKTFCKGLVVNQVSGSIEGTLAITASEITKNATVHSFASLQAGGCPGGCSAVDSVLKGQFSGAACSDVAGNCECTLSISDVTTNNYTKSGTGAASRLLLDDGSEFAACVTGGTKLAIQQTKEAPDAGAAGGLPGTYSATKK